MNHAWGCFFLAAVLAVRASGTNLAIGQPASTQPKSEPQRVDRFGDPLPAGVLARLGTIRLRQQSVVNQVAFAADGKTLVSAGWTRTVHLWDAATGKEVRSFAIPQVDPRGPPIAASSAALGPNGKLLAAGTFGGSIHVWDTATGKHLRELRGPQQAVQALAFAPDSQTLAAGGGEFDKSGAVRLWDAATGKEVRQLKGHKDVVNALAFAPDGKRLATAGRDRAIRLWDPSRGDLVRLIPYPDRAGGLFQDIRALAFSADGRVLASGGSDQLIHLWDAATGKGLRSLTGHKGGVNTLAFAPRERLLASGSADGTARFWDPGSGEQLRILRGREANATHQEVRSLAFAADGQTIACGLQSGAIVLHRVATGAEVYPDRGPADRVSTVAVSPDGTTVATGDSEGMVRLWDPSSGKELRCLDAQDTNGIRSLAWSPDGQRLAAATGLLKVVVWEAGTGRRLHQLRGRCVAFAADSKTLAIGGAPAKEGNQEIIELRDLTTGRCSGEWHGHATPIGSIAFSPDGTLLASGGWRPNWGRMPGPAPARPQAEANLLRLWDVVSGKERLQFGGLDDVGALAFSADGKMLASVPGQIWPWSGTPPPVRLWEVATGKERRQFAGHAGNLRSAAFSPDGSVLATASDDTTIGLWDLATETRLRGCFGHQGPVYAVAFAPDGRSMVSGSMDTTALIWDLTRRERPQRAAPALSPRDLEVLWTTLAGDDTETAYRAIWTLRSRPGQAVSFLGQHLRPAAAVDEPRLKRCVADLDSEQFAARERAEREIQELGEAAVPGLQAALAGKPTPEVRRRIERLLERMQSAALPPATLQCLRAVEVMEWIAMPQARQALETLAKGAPDTRLTKEAKAALTRLSRR